MNKEDQIKSTLEQLTEGDLAVVEEAFSTEYVAHAGEKTYKGHEFIKRYANQLRSAIPDIKVLNVEFLGVEGEMVVWQRILGGTHKADMMSIPPSGKKVKWIDMVVTRFENEKIIEEWVVSELAGELLLKQTKMK